MMMKNTVLYLFSIIMVFSCASPQKSFDKGDYNKAFKLARKKLNSGKATRGDRKILLASFDIIYEEARLESNAALESNFVEDWEESYKVTSNLLDIYNSASKYLGKDYRDEMIGIRDHIDTLGKDIANSYYELGDTRHQEYEESFDKLLAQDAYLFYSKAYDYDKGLPDVVKKIDRAKELGTINYLIKMDKPFDRKVSWEVDDIFSDLERESEKFTRIYYDRILDQDEFDCIVNVRISDLEVRSSVDNYTETFRERVEDGNRVEVDSTGRRNEIPVYKEVTGNVEVTTESFRYSVYMDARTRSGTDMCRSIRLDENASEIVEVSSYRISGDRRAIPSRYLTNDNPRNIDEEEIIEDLLEDLYNKLRRRF